MAESEWVPRANGNSKASWYVRSIVSNCTGPLLDGMDVCCPEGMVTCLLYLNDWRPEHHGELRLYASSGSDSAVPRAETPDLGRFVDVEPLAGRLVMFRSREVWHAVREPTQQRWALTLWVMAD